MPDTYPVASATSMAFITMSAMKHLLPYFAALRSLDRISHTFAHSIASYADIGR
jgi:hypothetical protein